MNAKISVIVICVEVIIYLSLCNLHDYTFNDIAIFQIKLRVERKKNVMNRKEFLHYFKQEELGQTLTMRKKEQSQKF